MKSVQIRSFFWSVFSRIRTEYRDLRSKSPYLVRIRETQTRKTSVLDTFHKVRAFISLIFHLRGAYSFRIRVQHLQKFKNPFASGETDWVLNLTLREFTKFSFKNLV